MSELTTEPEAEEPLDPAPYVAAILSNLQHCVDMASKIGRDDWVRKFERLVRDISGRSPPRHAVQLAPVGPVVALDTWLARVREALDSFADEYVKAHQDDPASFPLERTSADWFEELASRAQ